MNENTCKTKKETRVYSTVKWLLNTASLEIANAKTLAKIAEEIKRIKSRKPVYLNDPSYDFNNKKERKYETSKRPKISSRAGKKIF